MITNTLFQTVALAISAYSDEGYTTARKLNSTAIVGNDARIDVSGESYIGQLRWYKPLVPNINIASLSNAAEGTYTDISTDIADYIKSVRTFGSQQVNLQQIVSKQDGLAKIARDFTEVRAQDEHNAILAVIKGVAAYEVSLGNGILTFNTDADANNFNKALENLTVFMKDIPVRKKEVYHQAFLDLLLKEVDHKLSVRTNPGGSAAAAAAIPSALLSAIEQWLS